MTKTSSTMGTLAYMAPEQIERKEVDGRSDIFSFGIVFYEMLTGHLPFRGEHEAAIMYSVVNEEPTPIQTYLPQASPDLVHILDRALAKDPEERYQTVQDMLIDLRRLKTDSGRVLKPPEGTRGSPNSAVHVQSGVAERPARRSLWLGALGGLLLCAVIVGLPFLLKEHEVRLNPLRSSVALTLPFRNIGYAALSGDGKWIAFAAQGEDGSWDLYMVNSAPGSTPRRVRSSASFISRAVTFHLI